MAKATGVVASQLQKDADLSGGDFNSRPYYRMFLGLICSLPANDPTDGSVFGMLTALSNTLALVQVSSTDHGLVIRMLGKLHASLLMSMCVCVVLQQDSAVLLPVPAIKDIGVCADSARPPVCKQTVVLEWTPGLNCSGQV